MQYEFKSLKPDILPHKITKPIQLLAALLIGLFSINASFFIAAKIITAPTWISGTLCIAAIINVPIFLGSIFLLQTKFRAELQDDEYYSKYMENKIKSNINKKMESESDSDVLRENIEIVVSSLKANNINPTFERVVKHLSKNYEKVSVEHEIDCMLKEGYLRSDTKQIEDVSVIEVI